MTEQDARAKWCPFARLAFDEFTGSVAVNRFWLSGELQPTIPAGCTCIGERCMAWRDGTANKVGGHCGLVP